MLRLNMQSIETRISKRWRVTVTIKFYKPSLQMKNSTAENSSDESIVEVVEPQDLVIAKAANEARN